MTAFVVFAALCAASIAPAAARAAAPVATWPDFFQPATATTIAPAGPAAPVNDAYLDSLNLNRPGSMLNRTDTLKDVRNTQNATVQTNILNPCGFAKCPKGPPELTSCHGVKYGKTIWYDFYPDADGQVRIRTSGFDNVISLMTFNTKTTLPDTANASCVHRSHFPTEQLIAPVTAGQAYTIQVGGAGDAGGPLRFLFDYFVPMAQRIMAQATLEAKLATTGLELVGLKVTAPKAATVTVDCGRFCHRLTAAGKPVESFPKLRGVHLPPGAELKIYVTEPGDIGSYTQYDITEHNFQKLTRCLEPGSRTPQRSCH